MRALVTGARGFAGRFLCEHLRSEGDEVVVCDHADAGGVDILDREALHTSFARHRPEIVYHLAAFSHVGNSWSTPDHVVRVNVEGTVNVLDAARDCGTARVLVVGSAEEYGRVTPEEVPLREDAPLRPVTPYAASKVAASFLALQAYLGSGITTVRVRPFNHTGPGQSDAFVVAALAARVARAEAAGDDRIVVGSLEPVRDLTDVRDVVRAYRLVALSGAPGEVYNVCSGAGVSIGELSERLVAMAARPMRVVQDPDLMRAVDVPRLVGDASKLRTVTGWTPAIPLAKTLADVLDHARRRAARA